MFDMALPTESQTTETWPAGAGVREDLLVVRGLPALIYRGLIGTRTPSVFLKQRKAIAGALVGTAFARVAKRVWPAPPTPAWPRSATE